MATAASGAGDGVEELCREEFNPAEVFSKPEALKGYRVLSCTQYILGPSCASYLGELGAEVIKIKQPRTGEPMRHTTPWNEPLLYPLSRWVPERGTGLGFFGANYNEYFVGLDFHRPEARELMYKLAAKADVVVENYRPGTFDRLGARPVPGLVRHPGAGSGRCLRDHRLAGGVRRVPQQAHHLAGRLLGRHDAGREHPGGSVLAGHRIG